MNPNSPNPSPAFAFLRDLGLTYKVGLVVAAIGVLVMLFSEALGGVFYQLVLSLLELLDAPADREYLRPDKPGAGSGLLQFAGSAALVCGVCIVSIRLGFGLLGLTPKPELTDKLGPTDRLGLGIAVFGVLVSASATIPEVLLYEILAREPGPSSPITPFSIVAYIGSLFLFGGLLVIVFGGPRRREVLLGWTGKLGWGKLGYGWINTFAIALFVIGVVVSTAGLEDAAPFLGGAGIAVFLLGIAVDYFVGTDP